MPSFLFAKQGLNIFFPSIENGSEMYMETGFLHYWNP